MKNSWIQFAIVLLVPALSACGKSFKDLGKLASQELGVPVVLNASEKDDCARKQLETIWNDYQDLSAEDQERAKESASQYRSIVFEPTSVVAESTYAVTITDLYYRGFGMVPDDRTARSNQRQIGYVEKWLGSPLETEVSAADGTLLISPRQSGTRVYRIFEYETGWRELFDSVFSVDDYDFKRGLAERHIHLWQELKQVSEEGQCGNALSLKAILDL